MDGFIKWRSHFKAPHPQTYEGGLSGEPGNEAHGGYTFCGLGALFLLQRLDVLDLDSLIPWACSLQVWMMI